MTPENAALLVSHLGEIDAAEKSRHRQNVLQRVRGCFGALAAPIDTRPFILLPSPKRQSPAMHLFYEMPQKRTLARLSLGELQAPMQWLHQPAEWITQPQVERLTSGYASDSLAFGCG